MPNTPKMPLRTLFSGFSKQAQSRLLLLLIVGCFLIPAIVAKTLLDSGRWQQLGSKVQGELLQPTLDISELALASLAAKKPNWTLFFPLNDQDCTAPCQNALMQMRQVHKALGPRQQRVKRTLIVPEGSQLKFQALLNSTFPNMHVIEVNQAAFEKLTLNLPDPYVGIIDPMDHVILKYPIFNEQSDAILASKKLLKDLKYLLKISRIG